MQGIQKIARSTGDTKENYVNRQQTDTFGGQIGFDMGVLLSVDVWEHLQLY